MYYEIYIDVFFLINFMMDYLLLAAVCRMLSMEFKRRRVLLGALMGAVLTCLVIIIPTGGIVRLILCHLIVNSAMVMTGLGVKSARELVKALLMLYGEDSCLEVFLAFLDNIFVQGAFFSFLLLSAMKCWRRCGPFFGRFTGRMGIPARRRSKQRENGSGFRD